LFLTVVFLGCTSKEKEQKQTASQGKNTSTPIRNEPSFKTSESDPFNKGSKIESARKGKLTEFGMIKVTLPKLTPTTDIANEVINSKDMQRINVGAFINYQIEFPSFPFDYENDIAALKSLYKLHNLERVIPVNGTQMDIMNSLMKYTVSFLDGGKLPSNGAANGPSAFLITQNRTRGIGGTSEVYAAFLCQLSLACGYNSRIVSMHTFDANGSPLTHDICETYINSLGKWIVFDAYNSATCYLRDNIPQSALELHFIAAENRNREIYPVSLLRESTDIASLRDTILPRFKYIYIWRMNDILSKSPRGGSIPWQTLYQTHLVWEDALSPISAGGFDKIDKFSKGGVKYVAHKRSEFNWMLDNVNITLERKKNVKIVFYLTSITPNFDHFEVITEDKTIKTNNVFEPQSIFNSFQIATVNKMGIKGTPSVTQFVE
jgi:hypothetical protein